MARCQQVARRLLKASIPARKDDTSRRVSRFTDPTTMREVSPTRGHCTTLFRFCEAIRRSHPPPRSQLLSPRHVPSSRLPDHRSPDPLGHLHSLGPHRHRRLPHLGPADSVQGLRSHPQSLLPDFLLHPYRHYVISLLQHVVSLYLIVGLGWNALVDRLPPTGPARSTVREWVASFAYGAGHLLLDFLIHRLLALDPLAQLPDTPAPAHLDSVLLTTPKAAARLGLSKAKGRALLPVPPIRLHTRVSSLLRLLPAPAQRVSPGLDRGRLPHQAPQRDRPGAPRALPPGLRSHYPPR